MLTYKLRRGRAADARIVRKLFFSILLEHGLVAVDAPHLGVDLATFGVSDSSRDDFVVVFGGKVVGFIMTVPALAGGGELSKVFVRRSHRGRGVGTMLIARAISAAKARGYASLRLSTTEAFADAHAYYERHGWVRESANGAVPILYAIRLREVPVLLPPVPRFLEGVLSLLDWATRLRGRLARDLGEGGVPPRHQRPG